MMPPSYLLTSSKVHRDAKMIAQKQRSPNVQMERSYLKPWRDFFKLTADVESNLTKLLDAHQPTQPRYMESNLSALRALSACKFSSPTLRSKIYASILDNRDKLAAIEESQILIDGLIGIALGSDRSTEAFRTAGAIAERFTTKRIAGLKFNEKVELLNGICVADLLEHPDTKHSALKVVAETISSLNDLWFDNTENELTFDNFDKLREVYLTIKVSSDKNVRKVNFKNKNLLSALESPEVQLIRYPESHAA